MSNLLAIIIRCLVVTVALVAPVAADRWAPDATTLIVTTLVINLVVQSLGLLLWSGWDAWRNDNLLAIVLRWAVVLAYVAVFGLVSTAIMSESTDLAMNLFLNLLSFAILSLLPVIIGLGVVGLIRALRRPSPRAPVPAHHGHPVHPQWAHPYAPAEAGHRTLGE